MKHKMTANISLVLAAGFLTGCNQAALWDTANTGSLFAAPKQAAFKHTIAEERPVQEAMAELPFEAGKLLQVQESRYYNGIQQTMIFHGDLQTKGQNTLKISMVSKQESKGSLGKPLLVSTPSQYAISKEIAKSLPGVSMRWSNTAHSNAYGPYGYALGRMAGNVRCIYGWQNMRGAAPEKAPFWRTKSTRPELSVRLRVCRANVSSERLVDLMRHLRINADPNRIETRSATLWQAGNGDAELGVNTALPSSNGYISSQNVVAPETVREAPVRTVARKVRRVKKPVMRKTIVRQVQKPSPVIAYRAPNTTIVPKPDQALVYSKTETTGVIQAAKTPLTVTRSLPLPPRQLGGVVLSRSSGVKAAQETAIPVVKNLVQAVPDNTLKQTALASGAVPLPSQ